MFTKYSFNTMFDRQTVKTIVVSVVSVIVIFSILLGSLWYHRGRIMRSLVMAYTQSVTAGESDKKDPETGLPAPKPELPAIFSPTATVETAVQHANPAVVANVISKEVPKYKTS